MWAILLFCLFLSCNFICVTLMVSSGTCQKQGHFTLNGMHQDGDFVIGGLFEIQSYVKVYPEISFRTQPKLPNCDLFYMTSFQQALTMVFAISEINNNPNLLPNITLGYQIYDNCLRLGVAFRAATALISGTEETISDLNCKGPPPVIGVIGDPGSTHSIAISSVLGLFRLPMISYYATCSCLSDKKKYPSFFRTIPSDTFQVRAMVQTMRHFGWTWVGLIYSNNDYGLRAPYNVYKAVYALAHALHDLMQCKEKRGPLSEKNCADITDLKPWQLLSYLKKVNFTTGFGDPVSFDNNGDALAIYDVLNWQPSSEGSIKLHSIGVVNDEVATGMVLRLNKDEIYWNFEAQKAPRSVCSESCPPGTRKAMRKGFPVCCFDCLTCGDGEISNTTDAIKCTVCPDEFWSNFNKDQCVPKEIEFLSYEDPLGISLTTASLLGTCFCALVMIIFAFHHNTPIVRANNSELSFLLLLSLKLCFLCVLLFIGQPQLWTCQLRHAVFGISFVLCISSILVKTMVVIAVFNSSRPEGKGAMQWFGAAQQRCTVLVLTVLQVVICAVWLSTSSPTPHKNNQYVRSKIVYECAIGSVAGFSLLLGYIGLLAAISFLLAFLARNLPDNFNEAKFITFSMLIFCAVWIAFVPAYVSSPGKYAVAVEIFAILASSFGVLVAIFAPKCYIIILHPERNTKKAIMGRETKKY
ncbi:extracellular calcium-sensing receptor isoform X2 [Danio rerio]|uniref:Extracellular calcium-sensing receptor isoform X2 n=1 Tax=Danio rerio TaxID=7955 RepID=A0AC58HV82_DANRE